MKNIIDNSMVTQEDLDFQKSLSLRYKTAYESLYECYLGPDSRKADVSLLFLNVGNQDRHGNFDEKNLQSSPQNLETWQNINTFFENWQTSSSALWSHWVNYVWMEYDNDGQDPRYMLPNIFINTVGGEVETIQQIPKERRLEHSLQVMKETLQYLIPGSLPHKINQKLLQISSLLPEGAFIGDFGIMFQRSPFQIKLIMRDIPFEDLCNYLSEIGWKGNTEHINTFFSLALKHINAFRLSIDIGIESLSPKIGIECFVEEVEDFLKKWNAFFAQLVDSRLCTKQKKDALFEFIQRNRQRETLAHTKVVFLPDKIVEAKAYLYNVTL
jgi:hypothetical protein